MAYKFPLLVTLLAILASTQYAGARFQAPPQYGRAAAEAADREEGVVAANTGRNRRAKAPPKTKFEEDVIQTSGGDLKITSVGHASVMFTFGGKVIHVDPVSDLADYSLLPKADLILVTHEDGDHLDRRAVKMLSSDKTTLIVCPNCSLYLPAGRIMINGETDTVAGFKVEAVPAYNIFGRGGNGKPYTPRGSANGYILTFGNKRVYVAGVTESIPEMQKFRPIDVAFLPLNETGRGLALRTMNPSMFSDAVAALQPKILFPYNYGSNDPKGFAGLVKNQQGIDLRLRDMK
jgi:L-ascorbate metabolism protein UlaG (beta-lactamase superfamily)